MMLKEEGYGFEDLHKVIADGRIVRCDPVTKLWERRQPGVDKAFWDDNPTLRRILKAIDQGDEGMVRETKSLWRPSTNRSQPDSARTSAVPEGDPPKEVEPDTGVASVDVGPRIEDEDEDNETSP